jgi:hypothetical protein
VMVMRSLDSPRPARIAGQRGAGGRAANGVRPGRPRRPAASENR